MIKLEMQVVRKRKNKPSLVGIVEAWAPSLVVNNAWSPTMYFMEIAGVQSARTAIFASLMKSRQQTSSDSPDPTNISFYVGGEKKDLYLAAKTKYVSVTDIPERIIVMHPDFKKDSRRCFIGGTFTTPSPMFSEALRINSTIPFTEAMVEKLWRIAIEEEAIEAMNCYGPHKAWVVDPDLNDLIAGRIKEAL